MKTRFVKIGIGITALLLAVGISAGAVFAFNKVAPRAIFIPILEDPDDDQDQLSEKVEIEIAGIVTGLASDSISIDGVAYPLDANSELDKDIVIGSPVVVTLLQLPDLSLVVEEVSFEEGDEQAEEELDEEDSELEEIEDDDDVEDLDEQEDEDEDVDEDVDEEDDHEEKSEAIETDEGEDGLEESED
jgi:hypothetical protein